MVYVSPPVVVVGKIQVSEFVGDFLPRPRL